MGRVSAPFGVRGWLKVHTFTEVMDGLLDYPVWWLERDGAWHEYPVLSGNIHGKLLIAQLEGVIDRREAEALNGKEIAVLRDDLPPPEENEFYWSDLIGLKVVNTAGVELGKVASLLQTGANDVLVVTGERERLIPFVKQVVVDVDKAAAVIQVDWGADY
jgi:16S rRNA processing protein RimM